MMDTAIVLQAAQYARFLDSGEQPALMGNRSPTGQPTANVFAAADGYVQVLALRQSQTEKLFAVLGCPEKLSEPAFATPDARQEHYDEVLGFISDALAGDTAERWHAALQEAGVPVSLIRDYDEVRADPQVEARHVFVPSASPAEDAPATVIGTGYVAAPDSPRVGRRAPALGEHTEEILAEHGFSPEEIAALGESKAGLNPAPEHRTLRLRIGLRPRCCRGVGQGGGTAIVGVWMPPEGIAVHGLGLIGPGTPSERR